MKASVLILVSFILISCNPEPLKPIRGVKVTELYRDSVSIRALSLGDNYLYFGSSKGHMGRLKLSTKELDTVVISNQAFRSTALNNKGFYGLSINNPAQLIRVDASMNAKLVYTEAGEGVFYDALHFVSDEVGFALGDHNKGCMSVLKTEDGGSSWMKLECELLPESEEDEGAFAASNTNIKSIGNRIWMATTKGRVYRSTDFGNHWESIQTPLIDTSTTHGIYSMDFYDKQRGVIYGGDYTQPKYNHNTIAFTKDGGLHWSLLADGANPGYKSCVQFVPNSNARQLIAVGFTGIAISNDGGNHWKSLSDKGFYTIRFVDEHTAYAAGKGSIAKLEFSRAEQ